MIESHVMNSQLENVGLGQPITKKCLMWCKKITLANSLVFIFGPNFFLSVTGQSTVLIILGYNMSQFTLFCYPRLHKLTIMYCIH